MQLYQWLQLEIIQRLIKPLLCSVQREMEIFTSAPTPTILVVQCLKLVPNPPNLRDQRYKRTNVIPHLSVST